MLFIPALTYHLLAQGRFGEQLPDIAIVSLTSRSGLLYSGIDNYLNIDSALILPCDTVLLVNSNGIIMHDTINQYLIIPEYSGNVRLTVYCLQNNDTVSLGYRYFTVNSVPDPLITINNKPISSPASISKSVLLSCDSLGIYVSDDIIGSENWLRITDFTVGYNYGGFHVSYPNSTNILSLQIKEVINRIGPDHTISIRFNLEGEGKIKKQLPIYRLTLY